MGAAITWTSKTDNGISSPVSVSTLTVAIPSCLVIGVSAPNADILLLSVSWGVILNCFASWLNIKDHWAPSSNQGHAEGDFQGFQETPIEIA